MVMLDKRPIGEFFAIGEPLRRDTLKASVHDHDSADNGAVRINIAATADSQPVGLLVVIEMLPVTP